VYSKCQVDSTNVIEQTFMEMLYAIMILHITMTTQWQYFTAEGSYAIRICNGCISFYWS